MARPKLSTLTEVAAEWVNQFPTRRSLSIKYHCYESIWNVELTTKRDRTANGHDPDLKTALLLALAQTPVLEVDYEIWLLVSNIVRHYECDLVEAYDRYLAMEEKFSA